MHDRSGEPALTPLWGENAAAFAGAVRQLARLSHAADVICDTAHYPLPVEFARGISVLWSYLEPRTEIAQAGRAGRQIFEQFVAAAREEAAASPPAADLDKWIAAIVSPLRRNFYAAIWRQGFPLEVAEALDAITRTQPRPTMLDEVLFQGWLRDAATASQTRGELLAATALRYIADELSGDIAGWRSRSYELGAKPSFTQGVAPQTGEIVAWLRAEADSRELTERLDAGPGHPFIALNTPEALAAFRTVAGAVELGTWWKEQARTPTESAVDTRASSTQGPHPPLQLPRRSAPALTSGARG